jgi:peptidoglycan hydrolase-like protein with peptidoglycan-binding domain
MKLRFLVTAVSVLASVSLASAQNSSGAASEQGASGQAGGGISQSAENSTAGHGQAAAAIDLSRDDIRVVQRVLIERGLLHGKADGILGRKTREAISAFQRQQGIQETGSIDARNV